MAWPDPTFQEWVDDFKALWAALRPTADSTPKSDGWLYQHTLGHAAKVIQEMVARGLARFFPTTTSGISLDRWLFFIGRKDGQGSYGLIKEHVSSGSDVCAVTFTGVGTITPSHELTDDAGRRYHINETYVSSGAEVYNADLESIDTGLSTNLESGESLTFTNPPANVESGATLVGDLDFGTDLEQDPSGQAALLQKMQTPSLSGNWVQWKEWVEEAIPGTLDGWIWPKRNNAPYGHGTTDFCATQRGEVGTDRSWTAAQKAAVTLGDAPALLVKEGRGLDLNEEKRAASYTFRLSESAPDANRCDWDASANKRTVTAVDAPAKEITVSAVYGAGVVASGNKVFLAGEEVTVDDAPGEGGLGMNQMTFTTWPSSWATIDLTDRDDGTSTGFAVCSGGGLVVTTHTAIQAYLNGIDGDPPDGRGDLPKIGPAAGTYAAPITGWDDTFRIDMIKSAAAIAAGGWILSHTQCLIGGVAADAGPTYDSTDTVDIMTAVEVAIYEDKT
jgi:hypothetical protein